MVNVYKGIAVKAFGIALGVSLAALLSGCGGGGGSAGDTALEYKITLRADKSSLPVNIGNQGPGIGTFAPYTTVLHVMATEGGNPIVGTKDAFACNVEQDLKVGALYYLDGKSEHETDVDGVKIPNAYRNITLDSNSGGSSFHFHAGNTTGNAVITCSVTDPRDNQVKSASVQINVGGATAPATGMPANIRLNAVSELGYLGARNNIANVPNTVALQAAVRDQMLQEVVGKGVPNLQVYIQGDTEAAAGARLMHDGQTGTVIMTTTDGNGVANFMLGSGAKRGVIVLTLVADRADNNVANGIQDPIIQRVAVSVVNGIAKDPLVFGEEGKPQVVAATCNQAVSSPLLASGGLPPYKWSTRGNVGLPAGLELTQDGLVTGVPVLNNGAGAGQYEVAVQVADDNGLVQSGSLILLIQPGDCKPLAIADSSLALVAGRQFAFALSATGGTPPYTWEKEGPWPAIDLSPEGILSGNAPSAGVYNLVVKVTDAKGVVVRANMKITVTAPTP